MWYPGKNIVSGIQGLGSNFMDRRRQQNALRERANAPMGDAPQIGGAGANFEQDRASQMQAMGMLQQAAAGNAPSAAQAQLAAANQQNVTNQLGMAAQARGGTLGAQQRQAAGMGAAGQMATANQVAMMRAEEMAQARNAMAQQANAMAGMSGGMLGQNAGLQAQWGMGGRGMDLQALQANRGFGLGVADKVMGAGAGLAQAGMFFSDERLKTDIKPAEDEALDAVRSLATVSYRYKNPEHGPPRTGFLAQDLEKTEAGRRVIRETPEGKAVDRDGATSLALAGLAALTRKVDQMGGAHG